MKTKHCQCCKDGKPGAIDSRNGYGFNRLEGKAREWAADHRFVKSEYCVPVKDGRRFGGPTWQKTKCGDGRMGFSTRRKGKDDVTMEVGLDGQFKKKRFTSVRPKSARATASRRARRIDGSKISLASSVVIAASRQNPMDIARRQNELKKMRQREYYREINRSRLRRATKLSRNRQASRS
ncbi:MAG: hypothetical protein V3V74_01360 [Nitrosomonadaceae bacterium]